MLTHDRWQIIYKTAIFERVEIQKFVKTAFILFLPLKGISTSKVNANLYDVLERKRVNEVLECFRTDSSANVIVKNNHRLARVTIALLHRRLLVPAVYRQWGPLGSQLSSV